MRSNIGRSGSLAISLEAAVCTSLIAARGTTDIFI